MINQWLIAGSIWQKKRYRRIASSSIASDLGLKFAKANLRPASVWSAAPLSAFHHVVYAFILMEISRSHFSSGQHREIYIRWLGAKPSVAVTWTWFSAKTGTQFCLARTDWLTFNNESAIIDLSLSQSTWFQHTMAIFFVQFFLSVPIWNNWNTSNWALVWFKDMCTIWWRKTRTKYPPSDENSSNQSGSTCWCYWYSAKLIIWIAKDPRT